MAVPRLAGDDVDVGAADPRRGPREVAVDEAAVEADRLEDLRAAVALQRRDPHLRHDLQDALVQRLDVVADGALVGQSLEHPLLNHVVERLEREVGVDRAGAVADEQRDVVHFARVAGFEDQRAPGPHALRAPGGGGRRRSPAGWESAPDPGSRRGPTGSGSCGRPRPPPAPARAVDPSRARGRRRLPSAGRASAA